METIPDLETNVKSDVHILKTSLTNNYDVKRVAWYLDSKESILRWTIDLLDWERVMKLTVTKDFEINELMRFMNSKGYFISDLTH